MDWFERYWLLWRNWSLLISFQIKSTKNRLYILQFSILKLPSTDRQDCVGYGAWRRKNMVPLFVQKRSTVNLSPQSHLLNNHYLSPVHGHNSVLVCIFYKTRLDKSLYQNPNSFIIQTCYSIELTCSQQCFFSTISKLKIAYRVHSLTSLSMSLSGVLPIESVWIKPSAVVSIKLYKLSNFVWSTKVGSITGRFSLSQPFSKIFYFGVWRLTNYFRRVHNKVTKIIFILSLLSSLVPLF